MAVIDNKMTDSPKKKTPSHKKKRKSLDQNDELGSPSLKLSNKKKRKSLNESSTASTLDLTLSKKKKSKNSDTSLEVTPSKKKKKKVNQDNDEDNDLDETILLSSSKKIKSGKKRKATDDEDNSITEHSSKKKKSEKRKSIEGSAKKGKKKKVKKSLEYDVDSDEEESNIVLANKNDGKLDLRHMNFYEDSSDGSDSEGGDIDMSGLGEEGDSGSEEEYGKEVEEDGSSEEEEEKSAEKSSEKRSVDLMTLRISNLPPNTEQGDVSLMFENAESVTVIKQKKTKKCVGFGFIKFTNKEDAALALEDKNGRKIHCRPVNLEYARPKSRKERMKKKWDKKVAKLTKKGDVKTIERLKLKNERKKKKIAEEKAKRVEEMKQKRKEKKEKKNDDDEGFSFFDNDNLEENLERALNVSGSRKRNRMSFDNEQSEHKRKSGKRRKRMKVKGAASLENVEYGDSD